MTNGDGETGETTRAMLKARSEVTVPDRTWSALPVLDEEDGGLRERRIEDHYAVVEAAQLGVAVPQEIRDAFDTARNVYVYSWFVYPFLAVAELQALSALELALRRRLGVDDRNGPGLRKLLRRAIEGGLVSGDHVREYFRRAERREQYLANPELSSYAGQEKSPSQYLEVLLESLPDLRNLIAHGSVYFSPMSRFTLEISCGPDQPAVR